MSGEIQSSDMQAVSQSPNTGRWVIAFQILGTVVILGIVFAAFSSPGDVFAAIRRADPRWILGAVTLLFISEAISALKWWLLLRQADCPLPFLRTLRAYWIGIFYGTYLPGSVSGDAARVLLIRRECGMTAAAAAVFMQRNSGLAAMLVLAVAFSTTAPVSLGVFPAGLRLLDQPIVWFMAAAMGYVAVNLVLVSPWFAEMAHQVAGRILPLRAAKLVDRLVHSAVRGRQILRRFWQRGAITLSLSLVTQILDGFVLLLLARSLGLIASFDTVFQAMAATGLASMLPLTINGIGIREVGFGLMLQSGLASGQAVALGFLTTGLYLACALPGGVLHGGVLLRKARQGSLGT